jgi:outer membrane receptor protein involved in Fe transport
MSTDKPGRGAEIAWPGAHKFAVCSRPGPAGARGVGRNAATLLVLIAAIGEARAAPVYETTVVAPRGPAVEPREDHSAAASVITTDRTPRSAEDLPQLLSELPGVTVTRYGSYGSLATLSLRGSSPNQVAVYADGVPLGSAVTGTIDLGLVPMTPVGRIEVYRGSSPLGFGSSAMGGVVSLTSETPEATGASGHAGTGSFGTWLGGGELAWVGQRLAVVTRAAVFTSDADFPYRSDNRTLSVAGDDQNLRRQNNQLDQKDAALRATLALGPRRTLALAAAFLDRDQGLPARGSDVSYEAALRRQRGYASLSYDGGDELGTGGRLHAVTYVLAAQQRFRDPRGEINFGPIATRDRSLTAGATVLASRPLGDHVGLATLLDARHEGYQPHVEERPDTRPPGTRDFLAAGLAGTLWLSPLDRPSELSATVRAEVAHDSISPVDPLGNSSGGARPVTELLPVARLGLVSHLTPQLRLRANGGSYARLPTLSERYGNGGTVRGNPQLVPERGETADLGVTYLRAGADDADDADADGSKARTWRLALDATAFATRSRELIQLLALGYHAGYANVARTQSWGGELAATARAFGHAHLFVQATYVRATDRSQPAGTPAHQLPHQPALRAYFRPELRALPLGRGVVGGLYGDLELVSSRFADPANLIEQPGRRVLGAGASLAYRPAGLRAILSGYNLGDQRASDVLEYPLPGRSFFVTLEFAYSKEEPAP